jgi:hypothetical protein
LTCRCPDPLPKVGPTGPERPMPCCASSILSNRDC